MSTLIPSLSATTWLTPFTPRSFLRNGHLQTLAGNFLPQQTALCLSRNLCWLRSKARFAATGPASVSLPLPLAAGGGSKRSGSRSFFIHGLEGSSNSQYVIGNTARALAAGFNVVRMNMRSCGGTDEISADHLPLRTLGRCGRSRRQNYRGADSWNRSRWLATRWAETSF